MVKLFAGSQKGNTMGYIHCCGGLRKTKSFRLSPQGIFVLCELDYLKKCPVCGHTVVQITRIDKDNEISIIRKTNEKARELFAKLRNKILYAESNENYLVKQYGKFYLYYNEYGIKKKCYSNLKNLKLGLRTLI